MTSFSALDLAFAEPTNIMGAAHLCFHDSGVASIDDAGQVGYFIG
jgi:hypothetical protein